MKKMIHLTITLACFIAATFTATAYSEERKDKHEKNNNPLASGLLIQTPIIKATPPGIENSAAYFTIINNTQEDIVLLGATSDAAKIVELHKHITKNGVKKMQKVPSLNIPSNTSVSLKPGSYHIMLIDVIQPIVAEQTVELTLLFNNSKTKKITALAKTH